MCSLGARTPAAVSREGSLGLLERPPHVLTLGVPRLFPDVQDHSHQAPPTPSPRPRETSREPLEPQKHSPHFLSVSHGLLPRPPQPHPGSPAWDRGWGRHFTQEVVQEGERREGCRRTGATAQQDWGRRLGPHPTGDPAGNALGTCPQRWGGLGLGVFISHPGPGKLSAVPGVLKGGDSRGLPCTRRAGESREVAPRWGGVA